MGSVWLLAGAGVVAFAWSWDRAIAQRPIDVAALLLPPGHGLIARRRHRARIGWAVLVFAGTWLPFVFAVASTQLPSPLRVATLLSVAAGLACLWRLSSRDQRLGVDPAGMTFPVIGRIPWTAIDGLRYHARIGDPMTRRFTVYLADPRPWRKRASLVQRLTVYRNVLVLRMGSWDVHPITLFEAATQYRAAHQPRAMLGWHEEDGWREQVRQQADMRPPLRRQHSDESPQDQIARRLQALSFAMIGGWVAPDTGAKAAAYLKQFRQREREQQMMFTLIERRIRREIESGSPLDEAGERALERDIDGIIASTQPDDPGLSTQALHEEIARANKLLSELPDHRHGAWIAFVLLAIALVSAALR